MGTLAITNENFNDTTEKNNFLMIDFWAPWCGPCRNFAPIYETSSENHPDIAFGKVNTEEEQELATQFQIRSIPTLMIMRDKIVLYMQPGALSVSQLEDLIERAKELDMEIVRENLEKEPQDDTAS